MSPSSDRRRRAFLAAPFAAAIDSGTGLVSAVDRELIERLARALEEAGWEVESAHIRESWGLEWMEPEACTPVDYRGVTTADLLVAVPGSPASGGVHVEIGWASASGVPMLLLLQEGQHYSHLVLGISTVGPAQLLWYSTAEQAVGLLSDRVARIEMNGDPPSA